MYFSYVSNVYCKKIIYTFTKLEKYKNRKRKRIGREGWSTVFLDIAIITFRVNFVAIFFLILYMYSSTINGPHLSSSSRKGILLYGSQYSFQFSKYKGYRNNSHYFSEGFRLKNYLILQVYIMVAIRPPFFLTFLILVF